MGSGSVFDDIGLGASDLGFAEDPREVAKKNKSKLEEERASIREGEATAKREAFEREDTDRQRTRSNTILTGAQGVEDDEEGNVARRTLLGS